MALQQVIVDWHALHSAFQMNMPEVRCFLETGTGKVLKLPPGDPQWVEVRAEPNAYMEVGAVPSRIQYQWLEEFVRTMPADERVQAEAAINGKGAFRRFKDILLGMPKERTRWFEFRDQMMRRRVVEWVHEQGLEPESEPPWPDMPDAETLQDSQGNVDFGAAHTRSPYLAAVSTPMPSQMQDLGGNVQTLPARARNHEILESTHPRDVEALRDFLIEWSDGKDPTAFVNPLTLEDLANDVAKQFWVRLHASRKKAVPAA